MLQSVNGETLAVVLKLYSKNAVFLFNMGVSVHFG